MTVYIGIPNRSNTGYTVMNHAPVDDGSRRCTRLKHDLAPLIIQDRWLPDHLKSTASG